MKRPTQSKIEAAWGRCRECAWATASAGALGQAAVHHDKTGHQVDAGQTLHVRYGRSKLERSTR